MSSRLFSSSPRRAFTELASASSAATSSPFAFAWPTFFENAFREACSVWVSFWMRFLSASRARKPSRSSA